MFRHHRHRTPSTLLLLLGTVLLRTTSAWNYPDRSIGITLDSIGIRGLQTGANKKKNLTNDDDDEMVSPTSAPSESPAPSPSPSYQPTNSPTQTGKPTESPTSSPTESPAPSPSPSYTPTLAPTSSQKPSIQPTTTRFPTEVPSFQPSPAPTHSSMPSLSPSRQPTASPSSFPSVSQAPSTRPSMSPSVSAMPSSFPTYVGTQSAFFTTRLALTEKLTSGEQLAFVTGTEDFVDQLQIDGGLSVPQVVLEFQTIVRQGINMTFTTDGTGSSVTATYDYNADGTPPSDRKLQDQVTSSSQMTTQLELHFEVTAIYTGADADFDLFAILDPLFQDLDKLWIHMLGNYDDVFLSLRPTDVSAIQGANKSSQKSITPGGLSAILVVALVAVGLAIGAAFYSIKTHSLSEYGEALDSPRGSSACTTFTNEFGLKRESYSMDPNAFVETCRYPNGGATPTATALADVVADVAKDREDDASRPSMVSDHVLNDLESFSKRIGSESLGTQLRQIPLQRSHGSVDPPTESEVGVSEANYEQYGFCIDATTSRDCQTHLISKVLGTRPGHVPSETGRAAVTANGQLGATGIYYNGQQNPSYYDDDQELMLTKSMGGTLGATQVSAGSPSSSGDSATDSFFNNILSGKKTKKAKKTKPGQENTGYLGARPLRHDEPLDHDAREPDVFYMQRGGLYDVFAPAGPIGIVVDTTKEGPCVHSLKPTSPMLGLINPGDLIVGLDDEDTRSMTAATLTRLMARKSNQKERKITLLAASGY